MANARFWSYENGGLVKLTIKQGQKLHHFQGRPTDEGYSSRGVSWENDGTNVYCEWYTDGRDCDGRFESFGESYCPLDKLQSQQYNESPLMPDWKETSHGQRDHQAEAAGY